MTGEEKHFSDECFKFVISRCKNDPVATGQNKLWIYYRPQAGKCPYLYHCQKTLSMTKDTNCPYNVHSWADKSKISLCN